MHKLQSGQTLEQAVEAAHKMISDLCAGRRDWTMRIPAEPNYDPDLVIGTALLAQAKRIKELETALTEANETINRIELGATSVEREACAHIAYIHIKNWGMGTTDDLASGVRSRIRARGKQ